MEHTLAVLSCTGQSISFFDVLSGNRNGYVDGLVAEPHEICHDQHRNLFYISHTYRDGMYAMYSTYSHEITVFDPTRMHITKILDIAPAEAPHDLAIDIDNDILWVSVEKISKREGGGLIGVDLKTHQRVKHVECHFEVHWFIMTRDGKRAYTCNKTAPFISILDLENERMLGKIDVQGGTEQPALTKCGQYLLFPTPSLRFGKIPADPTLLIIDTKTDEIVRSVELSKGYGPASVYVTTTGAIMIAQYRFDENATNPTPICGRMSVYDPFAKTLLGHVDVGHMPLTMCASADGKIGFVANAKSGTVTVIDLEYVKVLKTIDVDVVESAANKFQTTAHGLALC